MRAWPRACALPGVDEAQAQRVPRSVTEEGALSPTMAPSIANGGIGRHEIRFYSEEKVKYLI